MIYSLSLMWWQWARAPRSATCGGSGKAHGDKSWSTLAPRSTGSKRDPTELPGKTARLRWPWWRNAHFPARVSSQPDPQLLLFHREPGFPKRVFFSGSISRGTAGLDVTFVPAPASHCAPSKECPTPTRVPPPPLSRGRVRGPRGQAAHVPPRHEAHSAGNSPEPGDPPSARGRTERKPRGTVNPRAPLHRTLAAPHPRPPRAWTVSGRCTRTQRRASHRAVCIQRGANAEPNRRPAPTAAARSRTRAAICSGAKCPPATRLLAGDTSRGWGHAPTALASAGHSPNGALTPSRSAR